MEMDEDGAQVKTLRDTLKVASEVYSLVEEKGITAVRLLSTKGNYFSIKPGNIGPLMKRIAFDGLTDIGTKLRDKVLVNHVEPEMKKPVLVIIVTDGEVKHPRAKSQTASCSCEPDRWRGYRSTQGCDHESGR